MPKPSIAVVGSHSALDVCRGAKDEGFRTIVIVEEGRDLTYSKYYKTNKNIGCVDEVLYVKKFKDILDKDFQKILTSKNAIFVPHRSFEVYLNDYDKIENDFAIPMFGNKKMLRIEERTEKPNQYDLLEKAKMKYPKSFKDALEIDRLVLVKVPEAERQFERAFFICDSPLTFKAQGDELIKAGKITREALGGAVIEEFILGVQVNFNFFYSAINNRLELIGTDTRRQTNLEGWSRLPAKYQEMIGDKLEVKYEEAGHIAVTTLESLLEPAFQMGERFVEASKSMFSPGIIGPFSLQSVVTPGPPKKEIIVFDVSPRMPGSPGIFATPYSGYLYGKQLSMGRRVAMEISDAFTKKQLDKITS